MSESSFDRAFYVTDPSSIKQLEYDLDNPKKVEYSKRDMAQENKKGIELIKRKLQAECGFSAAKPFENG